MTDYDLKSSNAGCLDNEDNKEILRKHLMDGFSKVYPSNGAVLIDVVALLCSLSFFELLTFKPFNIYEYLHKMYMRGFWSAIGKRFHTFIDPCDGTMERVLGRERIVNNLNQCATLFTGNLTLNELKSMYENPKLYEDKFYCFAENYDVADQLKK